MMSENCNQKSVLATKEFTLRYTIFSVNFYNSSLYTVVYKVL